MIVSWIVTVLGIGLLVFHKRVARTIVREQNRFWGFNFGAKETRISECVVVICGIAAIVMAALQLFQVQK